MGVTELSESDSGVMASTKGCSSSEAHEPGEYALGGGVGNEEADGLEDL